MSCFLQAPFPRRREKTSALGRTRRSTGQHGREITARRLCVRQGGDQFDRRRARRLETRQSPTAQPGELGVQPCDDLPLGAGASLVGVTSSTADGHDEAGPYQGRLPGPLLGQPGPLRHGGYLAFTGRGGRLDRDTHATTCADGLSLGQDHGGSRPTRSPDRRTTGDGEEGASTLVWRPEKAVRSAPSVTVSARPPWETECATAGLAGARVDTSVEFQHAWPLLHQGRDPLNRRRGPRLETRQSLAAQPGSRGYIHAMACLTRQSQEQQTPRWSELRPHPPVVTTQEGRVKVVYQARSWVNRYQEDIDVGIWLVRAEADIWTATLMPPPALADSHWDRITVDPGPPGVQTAEPPPTAKREPPPWSGAR
ncbi:DUF6185 family protein [Streptomyces sp. MS1.AVA.1]|uniref:DUF6185 family protein n=1 Tax=Streptomyces machairae TaxID=3134109 RepID=A0ABU8UWI6_9ACTN